MSTMGDFETRSKMRLETAAALRVVTAVRHWGMIELRLRCDL